MKRTGTKASYIVLFVLIGTLLTAGCSKNPDEGGEIILDSTTSEAAT